MKEEDTTNAAACNDHQHAQQQTKPKKRKADDAVTKHTSKKKKEPKKEPEKRLARYRSHITNAIQDRIERTQPGSGHRLFLVDHAQVRPHDDPQGPAATFTVMGATGNIYTTQIDHLPTCTCPDFSRRGGPCKHLLFVTLRVLNLPSTDLCIVQQALLTEELQHVLANLESRVNPFVVAEEAVRSAWKQRGGGGNATPVKPRNLDDGSECAICFDPLTSDAACCVQCHNGLHKECWQAMLKHKKSSTVPCPYCRGDFTGGRGADNEGGYVNLASASASHRRVPGFMTLYPNSAEWLLRQHRR